MPMLILLASKTLNSVNATIYKLIFSTAMTIYYKTVSVPSQTNSNVEIYIFCRSEWYTCYE